jgi:hypothetical protein
MTQTLYAYSNKRNKKIFLANICYLQETHVKASNKQTGWTYKDKYTYMYIYI